jgi:hypothetical protein
MNWTGWTWQITIFPCLCLICIELDWIICFILYLIYTRIVLPSQVGLVRVYVRGRIAAPMLYLLVSQHFIFLALISHVYVTLILLPKTLFCFEGQRNDCSINRITPSRKIFALLDSYFIRYLSVFEDDSCRKTSIGLFYKLFILSKRCEMLSSDGCILH